MTSLVPTRTRSVVGGILVVRRCTHNARGRASQFHTSFCSHYYICIITHHYNNCYYSPARSHLCLHFSHVFFRLFVGLHFHLRRSTADIPLGLSACDANSHLLTCRRARCCSSIGLGRSIRRASMGGSWTTLQAHEARNTVSSQLGLTLHFPLR